MTDLSHEEGYSYSQTSMQVGDILILRDVAVVLVDAWPTLVCGKSEVFHKLDAEYSWETLDDGKYAESALIARGAYVDPATAEALPIVQFMNLNVANVHNVNLKAFERRMGTKVKDLMVDHTLAPVRIYIQPVHDGHQYVAWFDESAGQGFISVAVRERGIRASRTFVKLQEDLDLIHKLYCDGLVNKGEALIKMVDAVDVVCNERIKAAEIDEVTGLASTGTGYDRARKQAEAYLYCDKLKAELDFHLV